MLQMAIVRWRRSKSLNLKTYTRKIGWIGWRFSDCCCLRRVTRLAARNRVILKLFEISPWCRRRRLLLLFFSSRMRWWGTTRRIDWNNAGLAPKLYVLAFFSLPLFPHPKIQLQSCPSELNSLNTSNLWVTSHYPGSGFPALLDQCNDYKNKKICVTRSLMLGNDRFTMKGWDSGP